MMRAKKFDKANYQRLVIVGVLLVIMLALTVLSDRFLTSTTSPTCCGSRWPP